MQIGLFARSQNVMTVSQADDRNFFYHAMTHFASFAGRFCLNRLDANLSSRCSSSSTVARSLCWVFDGFTESVHTRFLLNGCISHVVCLYKSLSCLAPKVLKAPFFLHLFSYISSSPVVPYIRATTKELLLLKIVPLGPLADFELQAKIGRNGGTIGLDIGYGERCGCQSLFKGGIGPWGLRLSRHLCHLGSRYWVDDVDEGSCCYGGGELQRQRARRPS